MKKLIFLLFLCISIVGYSQTVDSTYLSAKVLAVHDGDSYKLLIGKDSIWVRLAFVDCPEVNSNHICATQPYGKAVGDSVRTELKGKDVMIKFITMDIYNRYVVRLALNGEDYSTSLVRRGMAWVVNTKELNKEEYSILINYKKLALKNRIGLFVNPNAISPELFRKRNKCKLK